MKTLNIVGHSIFVMFSILNLFSQATVYQVTKDIIKYSFNSPLCIYFVTSGDAVSQILQHVLLEMQIPIIVLLIQDKKTKVTLPQCDGYIVATGNFRFLTSIFDNKTIIEFKPHKRVLIIFSGKENIVGPPFTYAADIRGIDIVTVQGLQEDLLDNTLKHNLVDWKMLCIISLTSNKILLSWNYTESFKVSKHIFDDIKWSPRFISDSKKHALKAITFNCPPSVMLDQKRGIYDGINYRILKELSKGWPVELKIIKLSTPDVHMYYESVENDIVLGLSDISLCTHWQSMLSNLNVDISYPFGQQCVTFLVPKSKILHRLSYVFMPLNTELWFTVVSTVFVVALILHLMAICYKKLKIIKHPYLDITLSVLEVIQSCTFGSLQHFTGALHYNHIQLVLIILSVQSLLLATAYSAGFASLLTYPRYSKPINTLQDMVTRNINWESSDSFLQSVLQNSTNSIFKNLANLYVNKSLRLINERICNGNTALAVPIASSGYLRDFEKLDDCARRNLKVLGECFMSNYAVMPFVKNSPFTQLFNTHIFRVFEHGLVEHWNKEMRSRYGNRFLSNFHTNYVFETIAPKSFSIADLQGAFYLLIIGCAVSIITFSVECLYVLLIKYFVSQLLQSILIN